MSHVDDYQEENRQALIDLNKSVDNLAGLIKEQTEKYETPKNELEVHGSVEVNTEPEVDVANLSEVTDALETLSDDLKQAIRDNSYKPVSDVTVKNIKEALPSEVKINNITELASYFTTLGNLIETNQPIVQVTKQEVVFPTDPKKPISVRLSDGKNFYNAITAAISSGSQDQRMTFTNGKLNVNADIDMSTEGIAKDSTLTDHTQVTQIVDNAGNAVSVTGGKLDVNSAAPVGGATSDNQTNGEQKTQLVGDLVDDATVNTPGLVEVTGDPVTITGDSGAPVPQGPNGELWVDDISTDRVFGTQNLVDYTGTRLKVEAINTDSEMTTPYRLATLGQEYGVACQGQAGCTIVLDGTFTGTVTFEATANNGGRYDAINGQATSGVVAVASATAVGTYRFNVTGLDRIRVRCSAAMTGAVIVTFKLSSASYSNLIGSNVITGTSAVSEATLDPTVNPIAQVIPIAPTVSSLASATTYVSNFAASLPQIRPRVRTEIGGDQRLPFAQQPNSLEMKIKADELERILNAMLMQLYLLNKNFSVANDLSTEGYDMV